MTTFRLRNPIASGLTDYRDAILTCVLWDLDSTIADTQHRHPIIALIKDFDPPQATWDDYSLAAAKDDPIPGAIRLMRLLAPTHRQVIITGRSAVAFDITRDWMSRHNVAADEIRMRPAGDTTENGDWKVAQIREIQQDGYDPVLFIEDWIDAARKIEAETDVPVFGANAFYPYAPEKIVSLGSV